MTDWEESGVESEDPEGLKGLNLGAWVSDAALTKRDGAVWGLGILQLEEDPSPKSNLPRSCPRNA